MVSVRDVLDIAELRLADRTDGPAGLLDRRISRIYSTELPDPARFLSGGELVISGLLWLRTDADVPPFVAALAEAGVAGLIACDADTGVIPPALIEECRRAGVPLLEGPVDLSFAVITERVGLELAAERVGRQAGGVHRRLISALSRGGGITDLLTLGAEQVGAPCWLLTPVGRVVAAAGPDLPPGRAAALVRAFLAGETRYRGSGDPVSLLPVDDPDGPELTRWFLVVAGPAGEAAAELASLAGVQRSRERESRRMANRVVGTLLRSVLSGSARPADIVSTAQAAGLDARGELRVLALSVPGGTGAQATAVAEELVAVLQPRGLVGSVDETAYLLLPVDRRPSTRGADLAERARTALALLEPALPERRVVLGVSSVTTVVQMRGAVAEARHARRAGEQRGGRTTVVASEEIAVHELLLATMPDELRAALRRRVLGPVIDYDAEHGGSLIETLTVFLDCSGSWTKAAHRLHVHVNTLRYRISRIEELLGADLTDFTSRVDIYLALNAEP